MEKDEEIETKRQEFRQLWEEISKLKTEEIEPVLFEKLPYLFGNGGYHELKELLERIKKKRDIEKITSDPEFLRNVAEIETHCGKQKICIKNIRRISDADGSDEFPCSVWIEGVSPFSPYNHNGYMIKRETAKQLSQMSGVPMEIKEPTGRPVLDRCLSPNGFLEDEKGDSEYLCPDCNGCKNGNIKPDPKPNDGQTRLFG